MFSVSQQDQTMFCIQKGENQKKKFKAWHLRDRSDVHYSFNISSSLSAFSTKPAGLPVTLDNKKRLAQKERQ